MAKHKLAPPTQELVINQGDDFVFQITIKDDKDKPVDLTGYSFVCKVREDAEGETVLAEAVCSVIEPENGLVDINFSNEVTSQIDTDGSYYEELAKYYYDIVQTDTQGRKERILQGPFLVSPGISYH